MICPNSKTTPKRWLKNAKAVSPVVATLLMIVISVVAGVMIYGWISGFISTGVPATPTAYIVTISTVTTDSVSSSSTGGWKLNATVLKVKVTNPGAKDIILGVGNFIVTNSSGYTYSSSNSSGNLPVVVYRVSSSLTARNPTASSVSSGLLNGTVTATGGSTTTLYVELAGHEGAKKTAGALEKGETYLFNTQDATTFDGIPVTSAEYTFKAVK